MRLPPQLGLVLLFTTPVLAQAPPAPVRTDSARTEEVLELASVTGEVRAVRRALLAAQEPGLVLELLAREGQVVEAGAVLARLDAERLRLERAILAAEEVRSSASLEERQADAARAASDLAAVRELNARGAANAKELTDAIAADAGARARVRVAEQEVVATAARGALLDRRIADCEPTAPFAGVVVARQTEAGQWLGAGDVIVELLGTDELEAWLDVPQRHWAALSSGVGELELTIDAGGAMLAISDWRRVPSVDARGRRFQIVVPLPAGTDLAAGMSLTATVPTSSRAEHLTVSRDAVLRGDTGPYVYVARSTGPDSPVIAELVPVEVLFPAGARLAVRAHSIEPGAAVVVEGNERLYPGAALLPEPAGDQ